MRFEAPSNEAGRGSLSWPGETSRRRGPHGRKRRRAISLGFLVGLLGAPGLALAGDADRDGVPDDRDAFPYDARAAAEGFSPAPETFGTILFEASPRSRAPDYNDVVLAYELVTRTDARGRAVDLRVHVNVIALSLTQRAGLSLTLPVPASAFGRASLRVGTDRETRVEPRPGTRNLTFDLAGELTRVAGTSTMNVRAGGRATPALSLVLDLSFRSPVTLALAELPSGLTPTLLDAEGNPAEGASFGAIVRPYHLRHPREGSSLAQAYPRGLPPVNADPKEVEAAQDSRHTFDREVTTLYGKLERFDVDIPVSFLPPRRPCPVDFDNAFSLLLLPNMARDTFAVDPYWFEPCWGPSTAIRVTPSNYGHFHASFEDPTIDCMDFSTGGMGRTVNGQCQAVSNYHLEPRVLDSHVGAHVIRIWSSTAGQPVPFDFDGITISGGPLIVRWRAPNALGWSETTVADGHSDFSGVANHVAEVEVTGTGPYSFTIEHLDVAGFAH